RVSGMPDLSIIFWKRAKGLCVAALLIPFCRPAYPEEESRAHPTTCLEDPISVLRDAGEETFWETASPSLLRCTLIRGQDPDSLLPLALLAARHLKAAGIEGEIRFAMFFQALYGRGDADLKRRLLGSLEGQTGEALRIILPPLLSSYVHGQIEAFLENAHSALPKELRRVSPPRRSLPEPLVSSPISADWQRMDGFREAYWDRMAGIPIAKRISYHEHESAFWETL